MHEYELCFNFLLAVAFRPPSDQGIASHVLMLVCPRIEGLTDAMEGKLSGPYMFLMDAVGSWVLRGIHVVLLWCEMLASASFCIALK